ncbi:site-specific integrase [bacterium]|nr:site-specific integrase [bacterium]
MPRERIKFFYDEERKIIKGRFYGFGNTKNPPQRTLCTFDQAFFRDPVNKKGLRTPQSQEKYLNDQWEKAYQELSRGKTNTERLKKENEKPETIYWLFDRFTEKLINQVNLDQRDHNTLVHYQNAIRYYKKAHRDHPIEPRYFNDDKIALFLDQMRRAGCSERTQWNYSIDIKAILNWGYKQFDEDGKRYVREQIDFEFIKKPKGEPVLYTTKEVIILENKILQDYSQGLKELREWKRKGMAVARAARELLGVYLLYKAIFLIKNTGMREGEVLHLPYKNINLDRQEIEISDVEFINRSRLNGKTVLRSGIWEPKGNKTRRTIDISRNEALLKFLEYDFSIKPEKERFYLGNGEGVLYFSTTARLTRVARKLVDRTDGINKKVKPFHSLRGWAITFLLAQGYPIPKVQDMVGHEDIKTTMGYFNMMENASGDLVGHLGNLNETLIEKLEMLNISEYQ